ncbi:hypothetical protein KCU65_g7674, partial [Aureobasidium melanogenum]
MMSSEEDIRSRLRIFKYDEKACEAAIRGEKIPHALGLPLTRLCVVRGIRYNYGYGAELRGVLPQFTRALNARSIMSDHIPDMESEDDFPYCIWYPEVASEATYRELVRKYPGMAYQVDRACAVAGYLDLYKEIDVLPEVHIAEEARDCGNTAIFEHIMSQPVRYAVMDDYNRTISATPRAGACLNGDTAVRRSLAIKQKARIADDVDNSDLDDNGEPFYILELRGYQTNTFDITEDMSIDLYDSEHQAATPILLGLLSLPLPMDLPAVDKDLLILVAAYYGDIDRYARLRRPRPIEYEIDCCVRGAYHSTMFAIWWSKQPQDFLRIDRAVSARMIMNNVLHRMQAPSREYDDPYLIWYPSIAAEPTYRELYRLRPSMAPQILRACIAGGYTDLFTEILCQTEPDQAVVNHANSSGGPFKDLVEQRVAELNGHIKELPSHEQWHRYSTRNLQGVRNWLRSGGFHSMGADFNGLYEGVYVNAELLELFASMPEEWKDFPRGEGLSFDYKEWPLPTL